MCIIVAKSAGIKMPSGDKLRNCFKNNPDGAGIMVASKGKVFGFKGLMTWESFKATLAKLEKCFGSLNKLSVVMHFRIGTHGTNIPENTHPFPLSANYDKLRETQWVSAQGVAHNGIIYACGNHADIKAENVSDTMVFIKRVIAPIGKNNIITNRSDILEGLGLMAGSKLAFMDGGGKIVTTGTFVKEEEVLYSNDSYKPYPSAKAAPAKSGAKKPYSSYYNDFYLSDDDMRWLKTSIMEENGLKTLDGKSIVYYYDSNISWDWLNMNDNFAIDPATKIIYEWDEYDCEWVEYMHPDEYELIDNKKEYDL